MDNATLMEKETAVQTAQPVSIPRKPLYFALKRCFDIVAALTALLLLIVPMLIVALIVKADSPGPAFFKQDRMGKNGKVFKIYKFRTMQLSAPSELATRDFEDSDVYITKFGAFLRRSSIDELPQLWNILKGDMSFVGYRPVCLTETELNDLRMRKGVFVVRPGITGLAQVSGRDDLECDIKAALDAKYVAECSPKMDLWCLMKTVRAVITGEGVY